MGTWICHLRIAENLLSEIPGLDEIAFTFGNLAPDSGVPNADWTQFNPPKYVTHFFAEGSSERNMVDLLFYRQYLQLAGLDLDNAPRRSFLLGYFFHLICDNLWARRIVEPTKQANATLFSRKSRKEAVEAIKGDWYSLDHRYVRDNPSSLFWRVFLQVPNPPSYLTFIPMNAIHNQLDYIRKYYSQPNPSRVLDRAYPYLNEVMMARFVSDTTQALLKIHNGVSEFSVLSGSSALAMLSAQEIAPYDPPLGDVV